MLCMVVFSVLECLEDNKEVANRTAMRKKQMKKLTEMVRKLETHHD